MDHQVSERRRDARFAPPAAVPSRATVRPGCAVSLVDVSAGGALIEAPRPLRPGARVHLQVTTSAKTFAIAALVTRCMVWSLDPIDGVTYRGALKFEHHIEWAWGDPTRDGYAGHESDRPSTRARGHRLPEERGANSGVSPRAAK